MSRKPVLHKEMMPVTTHMGPVLRRYREQLGLSLECVARMAGISVIALHNLETGKSSSKSDTYERVARALGVGFAEVAVRAQSEALQAGQSL